MSGGLLFTMNVPGLHDGLAESSREDEEVVEIDIAGAIKIGWALKPGLDYGRPRLAAKIREIT